jgi:cell division control protein 45
MGMRGARIRQLLRDEVRRLNPPDIGNGRPEVTGIIPTTARNPEDTSIRLSPEPRFLLVRHWSLYDSMVHSPYLFARMKTWNDSGIKRLHKFLAKMGVSLVECRQTYANMDVKLKRNLRAKLLQYAPLFNLDELVPTLETDANDRGGAKDGWGFVRSWGWKATLSAQDVCIIVGALLEVGKETTAAPLCMAGPSKELVDLDNEKRISDEWIPRFWDAYDALQK